MDLLCHFWPHLTVGFSGIIGAFFWKTIWSVVRDFFSGFIQWFGEHWANEVDRRERVKNYREKLAHADSRDRLIDFMAKEHVKKDDRINECLAKIKDLEKKVNILLFELDKCRKETSDLKVSNARLKNEYDKAAMENAILSGKLAGR
jgi:DNA-binding transcriptional regulator GbsR (MarR family)